MAAPKWAQDLVLRVARDEGATCPPHLVWRRSRHWQSSGWCWLSEAHVSAGTDRVDQRLVLLHELAHWAVGMEHRHDEVFWLKAWEFYRRYRVPICYARSRERSYRKGAERAYLKSRRRDGTARRIVIESEAKIDG